MTDVQQPIDGRLILQTAHVSLLCLVCALRLRSSLLE